jgi:hypothetical protein
MKLYLNAILPVKKNRDGGYKVTFLFPDCFYFPDMPNMIVEIYNYDYRILLYQQEFYKVYKGSELSIQPGHYLMIVYIKEDVYIIELM